jgi:hypothetical protein
MLLKSRSESDELRILRALNVRKELSAKDKFHYRNLEKGYEGEVKFDHLLENLQEERYLINDLLLQVNNSYFQIDTLLISQACIHLLDVKNFEDDFYLKGDRLFALKNDREYKNPVNQLTRSTTLFRQLLQIHKLSYLAESAVVFINPEFTLYQAPMDQPIILPTQVNRFVYDLNHTPSKLNDGHRKLAQKLISLHQTKNPYTNIPEYRYDELQKGRYCLLCGSFVLSVDGHDFVCANCGGHEKIETAILRYIEEYKLLFPDQPITTKSIYEWCGGSLCKKTFYRVLQKNFNAYGKKKSTFYK